MAFPPFSVKCCFDLSFEAFAILYKFTININGIREGKRGRRFNAAKINTKKKNLYVNLDPNGFEWRNRFRVANPTKHY